MEYKPVSPVSLWGEGEGTLFVEALLVKVESRKRETASEYIYYCHCTAISYIFSLFVLYDTLWSIYPHSTLYKTLSYRLYHLPWICGREVILDFIILHCFPILEAIEPFLVCIIPQTRTPTNTPFSRTTHDRPKWFWPSTGGYASDRVGSIMFATLKQKAISDWWNTTEHQWRSSKEACPLLMGDRHGI